MCPILCTITITFTTIHSEAKIFKLDSYSKLAEGCSCDKPRAL